jgi:hypothetical protein
VGFRQRAKGLEKSSRDYDDDDGTSFYNTTSVSRGSEVLELKRNTANYGINDKALLAAVLVIGAHFV